MIRDHDLAILNALARALSQSLDLERVLRTALDTVAELLHLDTGWVWLRDEATGAHQLAAARNLPPGLTAHGELMQGPCFCLTTYEAGDLRGAANVNVVWCSRLARLVDGSNELRCHASIPLYADDRKLGILNVASRDFRELSSDELNLLYTIGALVSLAIERTRLAARGAELVAVEERNRLAREIHDTIAQSLAAIAMQLESADAFVDAGNTRRAGETIRRALTLTRSTLDEARHSVLELRDPPLAGRSLGDALRSLGEQLRDASETPLDVRVQIAGLDEPLPPAVQVGLYHIAREALVNVARHARARAAALRVERRGDRVRLRVSDDGAGLDLANITAGRFGLLGMNERARLLGGELRVTSAPGAGTVVEADLPLPAAVAAAEGRRWDATAKSSAMVRSDTTAEPSATTKASVKANAAAKPNGTTRRKRR